MQNALNRGPERVAVVAARRTPIGKYLGSFADLSAADLGVEAGIPDFQLARDFLLLQQLTVVLPDLQPAALAQPERVLEQCDEGEKGDRQPAPVF